jgi:alpha-amylase/alpha-mannosidase (GH57 family)
MPWVRLHAVKGYLDLLSVLERYEHAQCVVNFSGILLEQIRVLCGSERDYYAKLSVKPAEALTFEERKFILRTFFSANRHTLIRPHQRYYELLAKKEHLLKVDELDDAVARFSNQDYTDLMVWFNLAWIGFTGQKRTDVRELILHGREYSLTDQQQVMAIHQELLTSVLPGYKALADSGHVELSFTPYHHPILPLLLDLSGLGYRNDADPLPEFRHADDAREQVRRGIEQYELAFGRAPQGAWPAEGSVSDAALSAFAHAGIQWVATDQQNLPGKEQRLLAHALPWSWERDGSRVAVFFRDTRLADNVGFEYATWNPALAGSHLVDMAVALGKQSGQQNPVVTIALDGENPWEGYADGGEGFLCALCERIAADTQTICRTPSQILSDAVFPVLDHILPGSWIGGNFNIWSRHAETRIAWRKLARARQDLADVASGVVLDHLLAAEASDWFWWYGDDFVNDFGAQFDELFRFHLIAAYETARRKVPDDLFSPIHAERALEQAGEVYAIIKPVLDGRETTFFEWRGALKVKANHGQSAMARASADSGIEALWYGFSATAMCIRLDLDAAFAAALHQSGGVVTLCISQGEIELCRRYDIPLGVQGINPAGDCAFDTLIELSFNLDAAQIKRNTPAFIWIEASTAPGQNERFPTSGRIPVDIIGEDFSAKHWIV